MTPACAEGVTVNGEPASLEFLQVRAHFSFKVERPPMFGVSLRQGVSKQQRQGRGDMIGNEGDSFVSLTAKECEDRAKHFRKLAAAATTAGLRVRLLAVVDECERAIRRAKGGEAFDRDLWRERY